MKRVNFYLKTRQITELKRLSQQTGASIAELIRRAVDMYLAHEKAGKGKNQSGKK